jgi:uncharacterized coiled-coil protein SlyX
VVEDAKAEIPEGGETRVDALKAAVAERDAKLAEQRTQLAEQRTQLAEQRTQLAEQRTQLAEQQARLAQLAAQQVQLREQQAQIALLTAQVAKLTEQQNRNSTNSHLPPSSDGPGSSTKDKPRRAEGPPRQPPRVVAGGVRRSFCRLISTDVPVLRTSVAADPGRRGVPLPTA